MATVSASAEQADRIGRRQCTRFPVGLPARLSSPTGNHKVMLENLSPIGANVSLPQRIECSQGLLRWIGFSVSADIVWQSGLSCGLSFASELPSECVEETALFALSAASDPLGTFAKLATAWSYGPGDW